MKCSYKGLTYKIYEGMSKKINNFVLSLADTCFITVYNMLGFQWISNYNVIITYVNNGRSRIVKVNPLVSCQGSPILRFLICFIPFNSWKVGQLAKSEVHCAGNEADFADYPLNGLTVSCTRQWLKSHYVIVSFCGYCCLAAVAILLSCA